MPVEILQLADAGEDAKRNTFGRALLRACNAVLEGDMRLDNRMSAATFNQCGASALSEASPEPTPPPRYGRA